MEGTRPLSSSFVTVHFWISSFLMTSAHRSRSACRVCSDCLRETPGTHRIGASGACPRSNHPSGTRCCASLSPWQWRRRTWACPPGRSPCRNSLVSSNDGNGAYQRSEHRDEYLHAVPWASYMGLHSGRVSRPAAARSTDHNSSVISMQGTIAHKNARRHLQRA